MNLYNIINVSSLFIFLFIAFLDLKYLKIHNMSVLILFFLGLGWNIFLGKSGTEFLWYFVISFAVIIGGFLLFSVGVWGAGDAKLMAVAVLFVEIKNIGYFIVGSFVFSALFAVSYLIYTKKFKFEDNFQKLKQTKIPFAPGIFLSLFALKFIY